MAALAYPLYPVSRTKPFDFKAMLEVERQYKGFVHLLFTRYGMRDVSDERAERHMGSDFVLHPHGLDKLGWWADNKFEQRATGRLALELVSVDRPWLKAGWLYTSRAGWLFSWFPSAELVVMPLSEARRYAFADLSRHHATSAWNRDYLSWNLLPDVNDIVRRIECARVLDLQQELNLQPVCEAMLRGAAREKRCTVEELVALMSAGPRQSEPVPVSAAELRDIVCSLASRDLMREKNATMRNTLAWLQTAELPRTRHARANAAYRVGAMST